MSTDWIRGLTVVKLKDEFKKRGMPSSGKNKAELMAELETFIRDQENSVAAAEPAEPEPDAAAEAPSEEAAAKEAPTEEAPKRKRGAAGAAEAATSAAQDEEPAPSKRGRRRGAMEPEDAPAATTAPAEEPALAEGPSPREPSAEAAFSAAAEPEPMARDAEEEVDYGEDEAEEREVEARQGGLEEVGDERSPRGGSREPKDAGPSSSPAASAQRPNPRAAVEGESSSRETAEAAAAGSAPLHRASDSASADAPAPAPPPSSSTRALRIDGFVRPFTERAVRELLGSHGPVRAMWMPTIKTHCFAVFETRAQAAAARAALHRLRWPESSPKVLLARSVGIREAELAIGRGAGNPELVLARTAEDADDPSANQDGSGAADEGATAARASRDLRVEELFRKTAAKPMIYWLPLSREEQAAGRSRLESAA